MFTYIPDDIKLEFFGIRYKLQLLLQHILGACATLHYLWNIYIFDILVHLDKPSALVRT